MRACSSVLALVAGLAFASGLGAQETPLAAERAQLQTMWEVLWHQSGEPVEVIRWEQPMRVHITGLHAKRHHDEILQALADVTAAAGVPLVEVPREEDAKRYANVIVEVLPNKALADNQPCVTFTDYGSKDFLVTHTLTQMREADVGRCRYHEFMHVMGLRGHPSGDTVLSYFPRQTAPLTAIDKMMLRAWYSPQMTAGMNPLQALPVLAQQMICAAPDEVGAIRLRDSFYAAAIAFSQAYVEGIGDVPYIVRRSGKATDEGVAQGRKLMTGFLQASAPTLVSYKVQCKSPVTRQ
jgi:hypothetical protein